MATKTKVRTTVELCPGDKERLQAVAAGLGLLQTTGRGRGEGSVSLLMQSIAAGRLDVVYGFPPAEGANWHFRQSP